MTSRWPTGAWRRRLGALWLAAAAAGGGLVGGCAPVLQPPGVVATDPRLIADGTFLTRDGLRLPMRCWTPVESFGPRAAVVALHGFNDYANAFAGPGAALAGRGFAVYAYDQRGFGQSAHRGLWAGSDRMVTDLADFTAAVRRRHPGLPLFLLGESMGGAVVMVAATRGTAIGLPPVNGLILSAPAVWGRVTMPFPYRAALFLSARLVPWVTVSGRGLKIVASDNTEMLIALGRDPLVIKETRIDAIHGLVGLMDEALAAAPRLSQPLLLLYGLKDEIVPSGAMGRAVAALPAAAAAHQRIAAYPEGYHMLLRDLQAAVVLGDIAAWMADPAAPLPSGVDRDGRAAVMAAGRK